jgi:hypothetical protein
MALNADSCVAKYAPIYRCVLGFEIRKSIPAPSRLALGAHPSPRFPHFVTVWGIFGDGALTERKWPHAAAPVAVALSE